jgi:hypothetical protein
MDVPGKPNYPRELSSPVSPFEFGAEGPRPFFPPVCLKTHWDPTMIIHRTLPSEYIPQALDPRPWAKICLEYTTTGENGPAPNVAESTFLPSGGQFYPSSRYSHAIDAESLLRRQDRPLGTCDDKQFYPDKGGDMYNQRFLVPHEPNVDPHRISELALPKVARNVREYECRARDDAVNTMLSPRMFNNTTKQNRYALKGRV